MSLHLKGHVAKLSVLGCVARDIRIVIMHWPRGEEILAGNQAPPPPCVEGFKPHPATCEAGKPEWTTAPPPKKLPDTLPSIKICPHRQTSRNPANHPIFKLCFARGFWYLGFAKLWSSKNIVSVLVNEKQNVVLQQGWSTCFFINKTSFSAILCIVRIFVWKGGTIFIAAPARGPPISPPPSNAVAPHNPLWRNQLLHHPSNLSESGLSDWVIHCGELPLEFWFSSCQRRQPAPHCLFFLSLFIFSFFLLFIYYFTFFWFHVGSPPFWLSSGATVRSHSSSVHLPPSPPPPWRRANQGQMFSQPDFLASGVL